MIAPARETLDGSTAAFPSFVDAVLFHGMREPNGPAIGTTSEPYAKPCAVKYAYDA